MFFHFTSTSSRMNEYPLMILSKFVDKIEKAKERRDCIWKYDKSERRRFIFFSSCFFWQARGKSTKQIQKYLNEIFRLRRTKYYWNQQSKKNAKNDNEWNKNFKLCWDNFSSSRCDFSMKAHDDQKKNEKEIK